METPSTEKPTVTRFGVAISAYAVSFALVAVSRGGMSFPGVYCAGVALMMLVNPIVNSNFFEPRASLYIPVWMIGWINIAFLASLAVRYQSGKGRAFGILRVATLLLIPFSWIVLYNEHLYPREGHVLWVAGMVLALFS
jgi:hypothetical protein